MKTSLLFSHLYLLPQHIPTPRLPPSFSLSHSPQGPKLIIHKVTRGLLLSPSLLFLFNSEEKKGKEKKPEGVSILITWSTLRVKRASPPLIGIFSHITSSFSELSFFIHEGEKVKNVVHQYSHSTLSPQPAIGTFELMLL